MTNCIFVATYQGSEPDSFVIKDDFEVYYKLR